MVWQCTKELRLNKFASATCLYYNITGSKRLQLAMYLMQYILSNASGVHLQHTRKVATYSCTFPFWLGLTSRLWTGEEISPQKIKN